MINQKNINKARQLLLNEVNNNLDKSNTKEFLLLAQAINDLTILISRLENPLKHEKIGGHNDMWELRA